VKVSGGCSRSIYETPTRSIGTASSSLKSRAEQTKSFDDAFANARANLPPVKPPGADIMERIQVVEIGALFGGIAGSHNLFVRICCTHD
jgi:hypothetical protein